MNRPDLMLIVVRAGRPPTAQLSCYKEWISTPGATAHPAVGMPRKRHIAPVVVVLLASIIPLRMTRKDAGAETGRTPVKIGNLRRNVYVIASDRDEIGPRECATRRDVLTR